MRAFLERSGLPAEGLAEAGTELLVLRRGREVVATAAVQVRGPVAYLRSLAVHPTLRRLGVATALVRLSQERARAEGAQTVFVLTVTETAAGFFRRLGYTSAAREELTAVFPETAGICPTTAQCLALSLGSAAVRLRKATLADVPSIQRLINGYAEQGLMLPRALSTLYEQLRDFTVAERSGEVLGAGALHVVWDDLAEVRSLAVAPAETGRGIGRRIVARLAAEAAGMGARRVFALTYQPGFFLRCGFSEVDKRELPHKVWRDCMDCVKFPDCDETAVELRVP